MGKIHIKIFEIVLFYITILLEFYNLHEIFIDRVYIKQFIYVISFSKYS